ncbi:MAG: hypothetical protein HOW73_46270 [Polyangiaceae bacterium]|nr:hypothetical protein [Polyangiaceae bacterium]
MSGARLFVAFALTLGAAHCRGHAGAPAAQAESETPPAAEVVIPPAASASERPAPVAVAPPAETSTTKICDRYWARLIACNEAMTAKAPEATRARMRADLAAAETEVKKAWAEMEPEMMDSACKAALDAIETNPACPK